LPAQKIAWGDGALLRAQPASTPLSVEFRAALLERETCSRHAWPLARRSPEEATGIGRATSPPGNEPAR
jgi:hypothetical protein